MYELARMRVLDMFHNCLGQRHHDVRDQAMECTWVRCLPYIPRIIMVGPGLTCVRISMQAEQFRAVLSAERLLILRGSSA